MFMNETEFFFRSYGNYSEEEPAFTPGINPITSIIIGVTITFFIISVNVILQVAILSSVTLRRRPLCWLVLNLSMADLLVGLVVTPISIYYEIRDRWDLGRTVCLGWLILDILLRCVSLLALIMINVDRFIFLLIPIRYTKRITPRTSTAMILISWIASLVIVLPLFFEGQSKDLDMGVTDICFVELSSTYVLSSTISTFGIPVGCLLFMNIGIIVVYFNKARQIHAVSPVRGSSRHDPARQVQRTPTQGHDPPRQTQRTPTQGHDPPRQVQRTPTHGHDPPRQVQRTPMNGHSNYNHEGNQQRSTYESVKHGHKNKSDGRRARNGHNSDSDEQRLLSNSPDSPGHSSTCSTMRPHAHSLDVNQYILPRHKHKHTGQRYRQNNEETNSSQSQSDQESSGVIIVQDVHTPSPNPDVYPQSSQMYGKINSGQDSNMYSHVRDNRHSQSGMGRMREVVLTISLVNLLYILMWLPFTVFAFLLGTGHHDLVSAQTIYVSIWVAYATSAIIPLLWISNKDIRDSCIRLFCCLCCCKSNAKSTIEPGIERTDNMISLL